MKPWGSILVLVIATAALPLQASMPDEETALSLLEESPRLDPTGTFAAPSPETADRSDLTDHRAQIVSLQGSVKILKHGSLEWAAAEKGMMIEAGDQILTEADSSLELSYDRHFLNLARIGPGTRAQFKTVEPTLVFLEDGTIFSALDGLDAGSQYEVSTPTAVAAVRGTRFEVSFDSDLQKFRTAIFPDSKEQAAGAVEVMQEHQGQPVLLQIQTGEKLVLADGQALSSELIAPLGPEEIRRFDAWMQKMESEIPDFGSAREEGKKRLEAAGLRSRSESELLSGEVSERPSSETRPSSKEPSSSEIVREEIFNRRAEFKDLLIDKDKDQNAVHANSVPQGDSNNSLPPAVDNS